MLAILMIFPRRCLTIDWAGSFESKKQALRFVSITPVPVAWSLIEDALSTITMELQLIGQVGA